MAKWLHKHRLTQPERFKNVAPAEQDSVDISLITCSPGTELYQLYGHTALRVREVRQGRRSDWVFNYGTFSFKQKNFMWRFMLGETDYELSVLPYGYFYEEYVREGRAIYEQRLNPTPAEEKALVDALTQNLQPENAVYRYNFFYDNCTTRALRIVAQHVNGKVKWPQGENEQELARYCARICSKTTPGFVSGRIWCSVPRPIGRPIFTRKCLLRFMRNVM